MSGEGPAPRRIEPPSWSGRLLRRPSAALVAGAMAGFIAFLSFLPSAIPLVVQVIDTEERLGRRAAVIAAYAIRDEISDGRWPSEATVLRYDLTRLEIRTADGRTEGWGVAVGPDVDLACPSDAKVTTVPVGNRQEWAVGCAFGAGVDVHAAVALAPGGFAQNTMGIVGMMAVIVGIVTALGVLRVMRPLSAITTALQRVGAGERGVTAPLTGLAELDALVERLNAAARSVDDREDAILARIELVQEMARIVAHEIRNPLQSLELLTSLVAAEDDPAERKAIGESIHAEIRSLEQVVNRLLRESASRGSLRLQLSARPIAPLVEQVVELRRPQANMHGIRLETGPLSTTRVPIDQMLMRRSIENLVVNALQAVPRGGAIRIAVVDEEEDLLISIDDDGPGVPQELVDHVFEANVSSKPQGTGLGLALVKGVIEAHDGYIRYGRSALGGARFEVRIPFATQHPLDGDGPVLPTKR